MGFKEVREMSQERVYVRRGLRVPMFDPDPDPIGVVAIAILAIIGVTGGALFTNPNIVNNFMMMLDPELKDVEEKRLEAQKQLTTTIGIVMVIIAVLVIFYIFWRWNTQKKEAKKRIRTNMNMIRKMRRMTP